MDASREVEPLWRSRLRWRLRGALLWPAFFGFTLVDALVLGRLPIAGDEGMDLVPALLLCAFFNLVAVAIVAPFVGLALRRRRRDLPKVVADDYAGAGLVLVVSLVLLAAGLAHRPAVLDAERDFAAQSQAVRDWARAQAPAEYRAHVDMATTVKLQDDYFRTCVPGPDPDRALCVFVSTDTSPPGIVEDPNREPNDSFDRASGGR
jgi:hypothetical protein